MMKSNSIILEHLFSVKAEKVFSTNRALWLSMYPYFAIEAPIFRNKITHNGLWDPDDIKNFANELIYDLFAIISAIKFTPKLPYNQLGVILSLRQEIKKLELSYEDYSTVLFSLFSGNQGRNLGKEIFDILKRREEKKEVLEFYSIPISEFVSTNLYEECCRLTRVIYDEKLWELIIKQLSSITKHEPDKPYDFVDFAETIVNSYIGEFEKDSRLKEKCILIKKELKKFY